MSYADQAAEVTLPVGAGVSIALAGAASTAAQNMAALLYPGGVPAVLGQHYYLSSTVAFTCRSGTADPGAAVATDLPFQAQQVYRFKLTPETQTARFFSTPAGTITVALASR